MRQNRVSLIDAAASVVCTELRCRGWIALRWAFMSRSCRAWASSWTHPERQGTSFTFSNPDPRECKWHDIKGHKSLISRAWLWKAEQLSLPWHMNHRSLVYRQIEFTPEVAFRSARWSLEVADLPLCSQLRWCTSCLRFAVGGGACWK